MGNGIIRPGLYIVCVFAAVCLGSPINEQLSSQSKSCTLACLQEKLDPVCGSDGRTYKNPCMLNAQNCGSPTKVVVELYEGVCSAEPTDLKCRKVNGNNIVQCPVKVDPHCGADGRTYPNYCELQRLICQQKIGIVVAHRGSCSGAEHKADEKTPEIATLDPTSDVTEGVSESRRCRKLK